MKKFLAIAMAAVLSLSLAACGGAASSTASSAASSEAASTGASSEAASASTTAYDYSSYTGETIEAIKAKGKLVLGTEAQYAPFEFKDMDANFVGCDIWLAQQVADIADTDFSSALVLSVVCAWVVFLFFFLVAAAAARKGLGKRRRSML